MPATNLSFCIIIAICYLIHGSAIADDNTISKLTPAEGRFRVGQIERIKVLVEMLASKNPAPPWGREFPKNYDKQQQANVYLAIEALFNEGSAAFDTLIDHLEDNRYSYTYDSPDDYHGRTVGQVCYQILTRNVDCYEFEIELLTADQHYIHVWKTTDELVGWWKENKGKPLWQLQVEAIDRAIEFFRKVDREKTHSPLPSEDLEKFTPKVFDRIRTDNLEKLNSMRENIARSKEPFRPKITDTEFGAMVGLPWLTKVISK